MSLIADLPIDALLPVLCAELARHPSAVLQAEPGAGKTTRVPPALLAQVAGDRQVWVVEPRRMAAVLAARHVAAELGEPPNGLVGYAVRFENATGPRTRLHYLTDGLLLRRLLADPLLRDVAVIVLDEFHERRLAGDLALALLRRLQRGPRPDLKIVIMSATLDAAAVSTWLDDAPVVHAPGRVFPVAIEHAPTLDSRPLEDQVTAAVRRVLSDGLDGDVLVFLPGTAEIRRCAERLGGLAQEFDLALRPLHGTLPIAEQERAIAPELRRKIVLATNIAETSVTLPGVVAVIDTGLHRVAGHAAWSGLPSLQLARISRASATQRAGRAGRVRPGRCLRLYTQFDHDSRPAFDKPEILRTDLAEAVLHLCAIDVPVAEQRRDAETFWLTPPPAEAMDAAVRQLTDLGALDAEGTLTQTGRELLRLPLPPRLARLVVEARRRGASGDGCIVAALLGERDLRTRDRAAHRPPHGQSDVLAMRDAYVALERAGFSGQEAREEGLDLAAARQVQRAARQLTDAARFLPPPGRLDGDVDTALLHAVLVAFPDRVAKRRPGAGGDLLLESGGVVRLGPRSQVTVPEFLVVVDAEERRDSKGASTQVRLASGIEPTWLLDLFADRVEVQVEHAWHAPGRRVVARERMIYRGLVLDETTRPATPSPQTAEVLRQALRDAGTHVEVEAVVTLQARAAFCATAGLAVPVLDDALVAEVVASLCEDCTTLAEVQAADLHAALRRRLGPAARLIDEHAPETVNLPGNRRFRVQYAQGQVPWIASRLQDFFGLGDGPRIGAGRVAVVLQLLAPNQRPVQVTTDLAGFWDRHYPALKKELARRYPKHAWPEDPRHAEPPAPRVRR